MTKLCPHCDGDSYLVYVGGPGYFSEEFGNYLPTEEVEVCPVCNGLGWVEEEAQEILATRW